MDIQTKDGILLRGIPDGTPEETIKARIAKIRADKFQEIKAEGNVVKPPPMYTPSGEKGELSYSNPDMIRGHPLVRFAEGAAAPIIGAGQLAANVAGQGAPVNEFLAESERRAQEVRAQLGSEGVDFWKLGGNVASPAVLGAMGIPTAATVAGRAGQGAAIGAGFGAASTVTEGDYWTRKGAQIGSGAALGAVIPPAIDVGVGVVRTARNIVDPLLPGGAERGAARIIAEAAGPKRAAIEAELAKNQVLVPGSNPTAAEAAARAGSPEFAALQKIAADHRPSAYSDIAKSQEAARAASIRSFGGDKAALDAAEKARSAATEPLYKAAFQQATKADPELLRMARNPFFRDALGHAEKLAEAKGITSKDALTQYLHYVKLGLDKELTKTGDTALSATEKNAVMHLKIQLVRWMGQRNPTYEQARSTFAAASKPINEMQVGQQLENALVKPIGEGERSAVFAGAVRDAPGTIKKATGQKMFDDLGSVLAPGNLGKVKGVLEDLSRKAEFERLAPLGRSKAADAAQPFGLPATGPLNQQYMIFKTVLGRVSKGINEKTLDTMADALQVPADTLRLLQSAPSAQRTQMINDIISAKLGRGAIAVGSEMSGEGINNVR